MEVKREAVTDAFFGVRAEVDDMRPALAPPTAERLQSEDAYGVVMPQTEASLGLAVSSPLPCQPTPQRLRATQASVQARALAQNDPKSWYTTAAFDIRGAETTGDPKRLEHARLSLDFAERSARSATSRLSGDFELHLFCIRTLREIVVETENELRRGPRFNWRA